MSRRELTRDDRGVSLVDMAVAMGLSVILVGFLGTAFATAVKTDVYTDESSRALASLRTTTERLGKELRQANRVYSDSTPREVHFWVDKDDDGASQETERIRWTLVPTGDGDAELQRSTDADGGFVPVAGDLIDGDIFSYLDADDGQTSPEAAKAVRFTLSADLDVEDVRARRALETEVELRNVRT